MVNRNKNYPDHYWLEVQLQSSNMFTLPPHCHSLLITTTTVICYPLKQFFLPSCGPPFFHSYICLFRRDIGLHKGRFRRCIGVFLSRWYRWLEPNNLQGSRLEESLERSSLQPNQSENDMDSASILFRTAKQLSSTIPLAVTWTLTFFASNSFRTNWITSLANG